jgi:hypothetical protein
LTLVATGGFASTHIHASTAAVSGKLSALPIPACPPGDPNGCGMWGPGNPFPQPKPTGSLR